MKEKVLELWPEISWIQDDEMQSKVTACWVYALENSVLTPEDLKSKRKYAIFMMRNSFAVFVADKNF